PGCVNTTEIDIKKACRMNKPIKSTKHLALGLAGGRISPSVSEADLLTPMDSIKQDIDLLRTRIDRCNFKVSKAAESFISYWEQYQEYDPFITATDPPNPWVTDCPEFWEGEKLGKEIPTKRVRRWAFSVQELLKDPIGREQFVKFLEKEFSGENLMFLNAVQELKCLPQKDVNDKVQAIWDQFLAPNAPVPVNIDSKSMNITKKNMQNRDRWTFDAAAAHLYHLMKSDSYSRYLRSEMYKEFLSGSRKK
ncbi:hypothetical protein C7M84_002289, partial [Penaeus vannamei]